MNQLDYQTLCTWVESQHRHAVEALRKTYEEQCLALRALFERHRDESTPQRGRSPFHKRHGDLIEAVRRTSHRVGDTFTLQDVEGMLKVEEPLLMAQSSRKSISTALRRLYDAKQLVLVEEGRGTKPARYAPMSNLVNSGKEIPMDHVSGTPA